MKKKRFWWFLPLAAAWLTFYLGFNTLPVNPTDSWWAIPLAITYASLLLVSIIFALDKNL